MSISRHQVSMPRLRGPASAAFYLVILTVATASSAWSQETQGLFRKVGNLVFSDGREVRGYAASLSGDTAVVYGVASGQFTAHVFERGTDGQQFLHTTTLVASDATGFFGHTAAIDRNTIVVGAAGAAFIFQRAAGSSAWQEVAKLTGDSDAVAFGGRVAVNGTTVLVGAFSTAGISEVYVFEQDAGSSTQHWGEVARLIGPTVFESVSAIALDGDTAVVTGRVDTGQSGAYVFSRIRGASNRWERVAVLSTPRDGYHVSISRDIVIINSTDVFDPQGITLVFERNRGGANAWGRVATYLFTIGSISGDLLLLGRLSVPPVSPEMGHVLARNQNGTGGWGLVARVHNFPIANLESTAPRAHELSGDTIIIGSSRILFLSGLFTPIEVYVADTDRDGIRDGRDPCPRDPQNNTVGGCQRDASAYPNLNESMALGDVTTETQGGEFVITATFTNTSNSPILNPFFEVSDLSGGNELANADGDYGGVGATLSPDVGDGILQPGEPTTVTFRIRLASFDQFSFFVNVRGTPKAPAQ